jgi:hypothetical protein
MLYTNLAGNKYQVDVLKYYISNIRLVKADSGEVAFGNYELIDEADEASKTVTLSKVPFDKYTAIRFVVGVDALRNHTGVQDGDLDPAKDMIWDGNTGYIFFKHEGKFTNSASQEKLLAQHLATDEYLPFAEVALPSVSFTGQSAKLALGFNLNAVYGAHSLIDFNIDNMRTSVGASDTAWMNKVRTNLHESFGFISFN